jgi:ABC-type proline/glycine betaine transport system ATPase subunit
MHIRDKKINIIFMKFFGFEWRTTLTNTMHLLNVSVAVTKAKNRRCINK